MKVLIDAPLDVRAERVARREGKSPGDAKGDILARESSERVRYKSIYGIDLRDTSVFDLVIDSRDKAPDEIVALIAARVRG
jgi:cytidylate kinase